MKVCVKSAVWGENRVRASRKRADRKEDEVVGQVSRSRCLAAMVGVAGIYDSASGLAHKARNSCVGLLYAAFPEGAHASLMRLAKPR